MLGNAKRGNKMMSILTLMALLPPMPVGVHSPTGSLQAGGRGGRVSGGGEGLRDKASARVHPDVEPDPCPPFPPGQDCPSPRNNGSPQAQGARRRRPPDQKRSRSAMIPGQGMPLTSKRNPNASNMKCIEPNVTNTQNQRKRCWPSPAAIRWLVGPRRRIHEAQARAKTKHMRKLENKRRGIEEIKSKWPKG